MSIDDKSVDDLDLTDFETDDHDYEGTDNPAQAGAVDSEAEERAEDVAERDDDQRDDNPGDPPEEPMYGKRAEKRIKQLLSRAKRAEEEVKNYQDFSRQMAERLHAVEERITGGGDGDDIDSALAEARKQHKQAFDDGDEEAAQKAVDAIAELKLRQAQPRQKPKPLTPPASSLPEAELEWQQRNRWWDDPKEDRAKSVAVGVYQDLIDEGHDVHDPDFYAELDRRVYAAVPRLSQGQQPRQRQRSPVATGSRGVSRSDGQPRITREAMAALRELGLDPNDKEVRKSYLRYGRT